MSSADITRIAFDPRKRYASVRMQQGRVLLDDDFNEAERISDEDERRSRIAIIGPAGTSDDGFLVSNGRLNPLGEMTFDIAAGSFYLGGVRLENPSVAGYALQDDWLEQPVSERAVPADGRIDLVYLEAWQQPVTAVEDAELFEVGLAGPDGAARVRTMWRVHVASGMKDSDCPGAWGSVVAGWTAANLGTIDETSERVVDAQLGVTFEPGGPPGDLCTPAVAGGYLGADNQAIRVELVDASHLTWGFDNAAPLYRCTIGGDHVSITLQTEPKDQMHWPLAGQVVEILPWGSVLPNGEKVAEVSGFLAKVSGSYDPDTRILTLAVPVPAGFGEAWTDREDHVALGAEFMYLRVWNRGDDTTSPPAIPFTPGTAVTLGTTGLDVTLTGTQFVTGDHWIIAARPETPNRIVPWQLESHRGPHGIRRWFAPLALIKWHNNQLGVGFDILHDCRPTFVPLTKIKGCCSVSVGDGLHSYGKFKSIQKAVDSLPDEGGKVCVLPGTYTEQVTIRGRKNITIEGCGRRSVLRPPVKNPTDVAIQIFGSQDITICSLAIDAGEHFAIIAFDEEATQTAGGPPPPPETTPLSRGFATARPITKRVMLDELDVSLAGLAAFVAVGGQWITVRRCRIESSPLAKPLKVGSDLGRWPSIWVQSQDVLIEHNFITAAITELFTRTAMGGIQIAGGSERVEIRRNHIRQGTGDGITLGSWTWEQIIIFGTIGPIVWFPPGYGWYINDEGCISIIWDPPPPPGGGNTGWGNPVSMGPVTDVRIIDNLIEQMGRAGIGVARFFDLKQGELITTDRLTIELNRIRSNVQLPIPPLPDNMVDLAAAGAIVLADADLVTIRDNEIIGNGKSHTDPICGVFALQSAGIIVDDNRMLENAPHVTTTNPIRPGWRGGIVLTNARAPMIPSYSKKFRAQASGVPAVRIHDNVIVVPEGRSILVVGQGAMSIGNNQLTSRGPGLVRVVTPTPDPATLSLSALLDLVGGAAVIVVNVGSSQELGAQLSGFRNAKYIVVAPDALRPQNAVGNAFDAQLSALPASAPGGQIAFDDNQVTLDLTTRSVGQIPSSVWLGTNDDLAVEDNQMIALLAGREQLRFNLAAVAWSQRVVANRLQENFYIQGLSAMTASVAMNTTANNQSTHCLSIIGPSGLTIDSNNLVLTQFGLNDRACAKAKLVAGAIRDKYIELADAHG